MAERYDFYVHDNRKITFNLTEPIMREDSGVTDFVFHIPKILNELEVSDWQWWLVFVNAKKEKYSIALTLSDDPESPLEKNVATYTVDYAMSIKAGAVQFALEAINTGTGGAIDNEWHTLTYETKVKETLQGNQAEYAETESDVISALIQEVRTKMNQVIGGATPTPVSSVSAMTDTSKLYLLTSDGEWYYYNGSAWASGGVYGAGVVDAVPTQGSNNAVSSGGVWSALQNIDVDITVDNELSDTSENPVQNKILFNKLNFVERRITPSTPTTYINADKETPDGYRGGVIALNVGADEQIYIERVDVRATSGANVKLGLFSFRRYSNDPTNPSYNSGYFTLVEWVASVTSVDTHAVYAPEEPLIYDPLEYTLLAVTEGLEIGFLRDVDNGLNTFYAYDRPLFYTAEVGVEIYDPNNPIQYKMPYSPTPTWEGTFTSPSIQGAYTVTYETESSAPTIETIVTPLKEKTQDIDAAVSAINTATSEDVGKALKVKTVTNGKVTEWEFGDAGGSQITVDDEISDVSENPVQNKILYNELNIVKTETIVPEETTFERGTSPNGYNGYVASLEISETNPVKLKSVDVHVKTGVTAKLGIWSLRRYSDDPTNPSYNRGYFTLEELLGTVTASDNHAVFTLNDYEWNPQSVNQVLIVCTSEAGVSYNHNVSNGLAPIWYNSALGFYDTAVGAENSTLMWYHNAEETTPQAVYEITYELGESYDVTTITNVKDAVDGLIGDVSSLKTNNNASSDAMLRKPINKYFCVIVDDVSADALTVADQLLAIGVKPAFGLKMESMGSEITWDDVKVLQDKGFEICFHGMLHSHTPAGTAPNNDSVMIADIAQYKKLCDSHGITLRGYIGPNHYPLPVGAFNEFEWARTPYGLQGYGAVGHLATTFASVVIWSCDPVNGAVPSADMINAAVSVGDNQYLTPMLHCQNLVTYLNDYLAVFNSWISSGLTPIRPMDAVKQSLFNSGGIGNNSTFEIQAGTATNPYYIIAGNGTVLTNGNT